MQPVTSSTCGSMYSSPSTALNLSYANTKSNLYQDQNEEKKMTEVSTGTSSATQVDLYSSPDVQYLSQNPLNQPYFNTSHSPSPSINNFTSLSSPNSSKRLVAKSEAKTKIEQNVPEKPLVKTWVTTKDPDDPENVEPATVSLYLTPDKRFVAGIIPLPKGGESEILVEHKPNKHENIVGLPENFENESQNRIKTFLMETDAKVYRLIHGKKGPDGTLLPNSFYQYQVRIIRKTFVSAELYSLLKKDNKDLERHFRDCLRNIQSNFNVNVETVHQNSVNQSPSDSGENNFNANRPNVPIRKVSISLNSKEKAWSVIFAFLAGLGFAPNSNSEYTEQIEEVLLKEQFVKLACGAIRGLDQIGLAYKQAKVVEFNIAEDGSSLSIVVRGQEMRISYVLGYFIKGVIVLTCPTLTIIYFKK